MILVSKKLPRFKVPLGFNIIASRTDPSVFNLMFERIDPIADQLVVVLDEKAPAPLYGIARQYTDDIYYHRWPHDFARQRNLALSNTYTPYVAWIDSDEWFEWHNVARISNLMTKPLGLAYYVYQVSPTMGDMTLYVPQIRIFPNVEGVRWEIPIHEQILPSLQRSGVKTQLTDLRVLHAGYLNPEAVYRKHRRNLVLLRREVKRNPEDAFTRSNYDKAVAYDRWWRKQRRAA